MTPKLSFKNFWTYYLLTGPLESSNARVLDFIEVLDSLGAVHQDVGSVGVGAEAPNLPINLKFNYQLHSITVP